VMLYQLSHVRVATVETTSLAPGSKLAAAGQL
jgi:hypothetical protein